MIKLGLNSQISEIVICFNNSSLQKIYFNDETYTNHFISESIDRGELYVYLDEQKKITGFMRIDLNGMFSKFPLLRCIAVNPGYRNMGIGKELLSFYENLGFDNSNKLFLCVSEFNDSAESLYKHIGYEIVGAIDGLYKDGIIENIMMKSKKF